MLQEATYDPARAALMPKQFDRFQAQDMIVLVVANHVRFDSCT
jgi:hypothetical protein